VDVLELDAADLDVAGAAETIERECRRLALKVAGAPAGG